MGPSREDGIGVRAEHFGDISPKSVTVVGIWRHHSEPQCMQIPSLPRKVQIIPVKQPSSLLFLNMTQIPQVFKTASASTPSA